MRLFTRKLSPKQKAALNALADGIECGAVLRPQGFQGLFTPVGGTTKKPIYASCVLGAAWECNLIKQGKEFDLIPHIGIGKVDYSQILAAYGVSDRKTKSIEVDDRLISAGFSDLATVIYRLNDWLLWKRERIAQFLREAE